MNISNIQVGEAC